MKIESEESHLNQLAAQGIILDPRYPHTQEMVFSDSEGHPCSWAIPQEAERRPFFFRCVLQSLGDWDSLRCRRHLGIWPSMPHPKRINDQVEHLITTALKLPQDSTDCVTFFRNEEVALVTLLFSTSVFGWSVNEDLTLIPDDASVILRTSHHDFITATFRTSEALATAIETMRGESFPEE